MLGLSVKAKAFWPGFSVESLALNAFTCVQVHKFGLYFVAVTQCFLQAEYLLGIVRGNVTNKQFWDAVEKLSQISIPAHLRRRGPCCQEGRSGDVTAAGKQEFSPQRLPLCNTYPPYLFQTLPPHALLTHFPRTSI